MSVSWNKIFGPAGGSVDRRYVSSREMHSMRIQSCGCCGRVMPGGMITKVLTAQEGHEFAVPWCAICVEAWPSVLDELRCHAKVSYLEDPGDIKMFWPWYDAYKRMPEHHRLLNGRNTDGVRKPRRKRVEDHFRTATNMVEGEVA